MTMSANVWKTIHRAGHEVELVFKELAEETEYGNRYDETVETVLAIQDETQPGIVARDQRETSPESTRRYYISVSDETDTPVPIEGGGGDSATVIRDTDAVWVVSDYDNLNNGVYRLVCRRSE